MLFNTKTIYLFLLIAPISIYTADFFSTDHEDFNYSLQQELTPPTSFRAPHDNSDSDEYSPSPELFPNLPLINHDENTLPTSFRAPHKDSDLDEYSPLPELFPNLPLINHDENTPPTTAILHPAHLLASISRKHERTEPENDEPYYAQPLSFLTQKHKKNRTLHQQTINPDNNFIDRYETHLLPDLFFEEPEEMPILHTYPTKPVDTVEAVDSLQTASGSNLICHAYLCNTSFSNKNDFHTHLKEKHSIRENHTPKILHLICESPKEIIRLACNYPECKITCTTKNIHHFKAHLITHTKKHTQKPKQLQMHASKEFSESLPNETGERILCEAHECNTSFKNAQDFNEHLVEKHSKDKLYQCNYLDCKQKYSTKHVSHFKEHLRFHSQHKPFKCSKCEKTFGRKRNAQNHMRQMHPETHNAPNCQAPGISYPSELPALQ